MSAGSCPPEEELLGLAHGDEPPAELARHVAGCAACRRQIEQLRQEMHSLRGAFSARSAAAPPAREASSRPFLGRYFLVGTLDESPGRSTHRGTHGVIEQDVIVTRWHQAVGADPVVRKNWIAAARQLIALDEPAFARVLDFDFADDAPYLVTEFVRGEPLDKPAAALERAAAARTLLPLARGVAAAHEAGVQRVGIAEARVLVGNDGQLRLTSWGRDWLADSGQEPGQAEDLAGLLAIFRRLTGGQTLVGDPGNAPRTARELANELERLAAPRNAGWIWVALTVGAAVLLLLVWFVRR